MSNRTQNNVAYNPPPAMPPQQPGYGPQYSPPYAPPPPPVATPPRPVRRRWRLHPACLGCLLIFAAFVGIVSCVALVGGLIVWNNLTTQLGDTWNQKLKESEQTTFQTSRIYDRQGNELYEMIGQGRRTKIKLADMPTALIDATIAVEDNTFYENSGVDWSAVTRAGLQYFGIAAGSSGGSTITQQLVRNIAFDYQKRQERTAQRKFEEIVMALILTRDKPKDEILEMYLNQIYYGNLAYGIEAAAQTYFGKSAKDLNLAEASLLAGLPQAPADLDPLNLDPKVQDAVFARRKIVLDLMVDKGKISRDEASKTLAQSLTYANPNVNLHSPHFTLYAQDELKSLLAGLNLPPSFLTNSGLKVYTTLDNRYQTLVEGVARQQIAAIRDKNNAHNAAVVVLKPGTGEILAMLGSVDYYDASIQGKVNVATSGKQPGSAIKPLTYAAAMEKGFIPASVLWDVEAHIKTPGQTYSPVNYDRRFHGPVRLRDALANSYNIPAVQTLRSVGVDYLLNFAQRMGVNSFDAAHPEKYGLSLTLGGGELTPLELTRAYSIFANRGVAVPSTSILCIIDSEGKIVYQYEEGCNGRGGTPSDKTISAKAPNVDDPNEKKVLDSRVAFVISDILADNAARTPAMGSNSPLRTDGIITSVKTGTTNDYRDNWTVGYTKNVVVGVWVGNTDSKPMTNTSGLTGAAPIWNGIIKGIYGNPDLMETLKRAGKLQDDRLTPPPGVYKRQICNIAALKDPAPTCPPGRSEWYFDSPVGIPDAKGKIVIPPPNRQAPTQPPRNGPVIVDLDPGVAQTLVFPLDPGLAGAMMANYKPAPGQPVPPAPLYCLVPNEVKDQVQPVTSQVFIKPPIFKDDIVYARLWAQANGVPILPEYPCTPEMLVSVPQVAGATAIITSPHPGQAVTGQMQAVGTANWQPGQATFFKMEVQGPQFPNWTTFSETKSTPTINGLLGEFPTAGLQPGTYKIRIVIVGNDGNFLATSSEIPITITGQ